MCQFNTNCSLSSSQSLLCDFIKIVIVHIEPECSGRKENQFLTVSTLEPPREKDSLPIQRNSMKCAGDSCQMHQSCNDLHYEIKFCGFAPAEIHVIFLSFHKTQSETSQASVVVMSEMGEIWRRNKKNLNKVAS